MSPANVLDAAFVVALIALAAIVLQVIGLIGLRLRRGGRLPLTGRGEGRRDADDDMRGR
jgi:hypothetical protein